MCVAEIVQIDKQDRGLAGYSSLLSSYDDSTQITATQRACMLVYEIEGFW